MNLTPKEIVQQLDRYIIGQAEAKVRLQLHFAIDIEEVCWMKAKRRLHRKYHYDGQPELVKPSWHGV